MLENIVLFNFMTDKNSRFSFALDWIEKISVNFNFVFVITLNAGEYKLPENVKVFNLNRKKHSRLRVILRLWKTLALLHKKYHISAYFIHMAIRFTLLIFPFKLIFRPKLVIWYAHQAIPVELIISDKLADTAFTCTKYAYNLSNPKNLKIIGHGINMNKFTLSRRKIQKINNIVTIGRITSVKNLDILINSFIELADDFPNIKLFLIGGTVRQDDKEYEIKLKKMAKDYRDRIIFIGEVKFNSIKKYYNSSDLFINLSASSSLDKAILEAMACGIPVLSTNKSAVSLFSHLYGKGFFPSSIETFSKDMRKILTSEIKLDPEALREEILNNHSLKRLANIISSELIRR